MYKDINGFEGLYMISNTGDVYSVKRDITLKPKKDKDGYFEVCLYNGKNNYRRVHRLVAEAFIPQTDGCNIVNHLDCNKQNNNAQNLEWTTVSGNTKHCYKNNKIFREQVLNNAIKGANKNKKKVSINGMTFSCKADAAKYFNVNEKTIYNWLHKVVV